MILKNELITQEHTFIEFEDDYKFNAPHHFKIKNVDGNGVLAEINFQEGPVKECGINGIFIPDLIAIVIERLNGFQNSDYKCRENAIAITKLEESLMWLRKRTMNRKNRGVEGTSAV